MNAHVPMQSLQQPAGNETETLIRRALGNLDRDARAKVVEATGWDDSMISKIRSGQAGITLDKLDKLLTALDLSIQEGWYMRYLAQGNQVGAMCCRARMSLGPCGGMR